MDSKVLPGIDLGLMCVTKNRSGNSYVIYSTTICQETCTPRASWFLLGSQDVLNVGARQPNTACLKHERNNSFRAVSGSDLRTPIWTGEAKWKCSGSPPGIRVRLNLRELLARVRLISRRTGRRPEPLGYGATYCAPMVLVPEAGSQLPKKSVSAMPLHPAAAPIAGDWSRKVKDVVGLPTPL